MTGAPLPPPATVLPCQADPERWFDRHHHADALAACRICPARVGCAHEALECHASWGLWAGVWIDGRHEDAMPHLHAVATGALTQATAIASAQIDERPGDADRVATPLRRPSV